MTIWKLRLNSAARKTSPCISLHTFGTEEKDATPRANTIIYLEKVKQGKDAFRDQVELILALVFNHLTSKKSAVKLMACLLLCFKDKFHYYSTFANSAWELNKLGLFYKNVVFDDLREECLKQSHFFLTSAIFFKFRTK